MILGLMVLLTAKGAKVWRKGRKELTFPAGVVDFFHFTMVNIIKFRQMSPEDPSFFHR